MLLSGGHLLQALPQLLQVLLREVLPIGQHAHNALGVGNIGQWIGAEQH